MGRYRKYISAPVCLMRLNTFGAAVALNRGGIPGTVRVSVNQRIANLLSGETLRVVFA